MTSTTPTDADTVPETSSTPIPAAFGSPEALNLGEFRGTGTIAGPAAAAKQVLTAGRDTFDLSAGVQFFFNGTPAVVRLGDTVEDVHQDWMKRRDAYQRAAGII
jgi:hypothetical protein